MLRGNAELDKAESNDLGRYSINAIERILSKPIGESGIKGKAEKMAVDQEEIFDALHEERNFQDKKLGHIDDHKHSVPEWLLIMRKLLEKAENDWMKSEMVCSTE